MTLLFPLLTPPTGSVFIDIVVQYLFVIFVMKTQHYRTFADSTLIVTLHSYSNRVSEPLATLITVTIFALKLSLPV